MRARFMDLVENTPAVLHTLRHAWIQTRGSGRFATPFLLLDLSLCTRTETGLAICVKSVELSELTQLATSDICHEMRTICLTAHQEPELHAPLLVTENGHERIGNRAPMWVTEVSF